MCSMLMHAVCVHFFRGNFTPSVKVVGLRHVRGCPLGVCRRESQLVAGPPLAFCPLRDADPPVRPSSLGTGTALNDLIKYLQSLFYKFTAMNLSVRQFFADWCCLVNRGLRASPESGSSSTWGSICQRLFPSVLSAHCSGAEPPVRPLSLGAGEALVWIIRSFD